MLLKLMKLCGKMGWGRRSRGSGTGPASSRRCGTTPSCGTSACLKASAATAASLACSNGNGRSGWRRWIATSTRARSPATQRTPSVASRRRHRHHRRHLLRPQHQAPTLHRHRHHRHRHQDPCHNRGKDGVSRTTAHPAKPLALAASRSGRTCLGSRSRPARPANRTL